LAIVTSTTTEQAANIAQGEFYDVENIIYSSTLLPHHHIVVCRHSTIVHDFMSMVLLYYITIIDFSHFCRYTNKYLHKSLGTHIARNAAASACDLY
jgi:hypothetical protein